MFNRLGSYISTNVCVRFEGTQTDTVLLPLDKPVRTLIGRVIKSITQQYI